jgi:ABC-type thiamin/hydroxymethylpyrimidine transport system permease subunit
LLAACNGALELTLGSYLHLIHFPLVGSVMVGINIIVYSLGYSMVPRKGTILSMGIITALLNLLFGGAFKPWSILAIILEALIIEIIILILDFKFTSVLISSISANIFAFFYTVMVIALVVGKGVFYSLSVALSRIIPDPSILKSSVLLITVLMVLLHAFFGWLFADIAWKLVERAEIFSRRVNHGKPLE